MRYRFLNKLYAKIFGYFWIPCPICKENYGGHEYIGGNTNYKHSDSGWIADMICPDCFQLGLGEDIPSNTRVKFLNRRN